MKIDELPPELLIKIFSYLSTYKQVSLVNCKFHAVACEVNDKNLTLTLDHRLLHSPDKTLRSIEESNRKISKVEIDLHCLTETDFMTLLSIISRSSANIKYLQIVGHSIEMAYFLKILSLVPNAEHLSFRGLTYADRMSGNENLNLKHLRILRLFFCGKLFPIVFNGLPAGVITELQLEGGDLFIWNTFFLRQTNIKELSLVSCTGGAQFTADILNNLELKSLEIRDMDIPTAALYRQTKLKSLTMTEIHKGDEHIMKLLASRLTELEELDWEISETPVIDFVNIERFKNLKHLGLHFEMFNRPYILEEFIQMDNSRIVKLEISGYYELSDHLIQTLTKSAPKLKVVKFPDNLTCEETSVVLKHFNFVECLECLSFDLFSANESYEDYLNQSESGNAKLTELSLSINQYEMSLLRKMIADFPNLKKLKIESQDDLVSSHFRLILDGFTKLESMKLDHGKQLTIDDFKYLRDHRKCLNCLWLNGVDEAIARLHLEDLRAMFGDVKVSSYSLHLKIKI